MALSGIPPRPNESNPTVIKAFKFVEQANTLFELGILTPAQKKLVVDKLNKLTTKVKSLYELEDQHAKTLKEEKVAESLSSTFRSSVSLLESRLELSQISLQLEEKRLRVQKRYDDIRQLSNSVQRINMETQREVEKNERQRNAAREASFKLESNSEIIKSNLENSAEVCKLRRTEEKKRQTEKAVEKLRAQKQAFEVQIRTMKATLKAENKKAFQKILVECARAFQLFKTLSPKLASSKKNVETLKAEELQRRTSGNLDETILFDNSFVQVSMDSGSNPTATTAANEKTVPAEKDKNIPETTTKTSEKSAAPPPPAIVSAPSEKVHVDKDISIRSHNESDTGSGNKSSNEGNTSVQNVTILDKHDEEQQVEDVEKSINEEQNDADCSKNISEELMEDDAVVEDVVMEEPEDVNNITNESHAEKMEEGDENEENDHDKSVDIMIDEAAQENEDDADPIAVSDLANVSKNGSFNFSRDSDSGGFFDKLLSKKSPESASGDEAASQKNKRSAADAILDISANSNDEANDLLKEMENQMGADDLMSQGSGNDNFSFNIFGGSTGANNDSATGANFDFNFNSGSDDNNGFDFMGGSSGADGGNSDADPFGFGKVSGKEKGDGAGDGMSFDFNFGSSDNAGAGGGSSFFNF